MESSTRSLALLQAEQNERKDLRCIQYALYGVRGTKTQEVVDVLLKYLDFQRPVTQEETIIRPHLVTWSDLYPAIDSLSLMGDIAIPGILDTIASNEQSKLVHTNALIALAEINDNYAPTVVALLQQEQTKRRNGEETRLTQAANELVAMCEAGQKISCRAVATPTTK